MLRSLFGFNFEGLSSEDDPDLDAIVLTGYVVNAR